MIGLVETFFLYLNSSLRIYLIKKSLLTTKIIPNFWYTLCLIKKIKTKIPFHLNSNFEFRDSIRKRTAAIGMGWATPRLSRFFVRFFRRYYYEKKCGVSKAERRVGAWRGFPGLIEARRWGAGRWRHALIIGRGVQWWPPFIKNEC